MDDLLQYVRKKGVDVLNAKLRGKSIVGNVLSNEAEGSFYGLFEKLIPFNP